MKDMQNEESGLGRDPETTLFAQAQGGGGGGRTN